MVNPHPPSSIKYQIFHFQNYNCFEWVLNKANNYWVKHICKWSRWKIRIVDERTNETIVFLKSVTDLLLKNRVIDRMQRARLWHIINYTPPLPYIARLPRNAASGDTYGPFYWYGLSEIRVWIGNRTNGFVWRVTTHPWIDFTAWVLAWVHNYIPTFTYRWRPFCSHKLQQLPMIDISFS